MALRAAPAKSDASTPVSAAPDGPWADPDLPATVEDLRGLIRTQTRTILFEHAAANIGRNPTSPLGNVHLIGRADREWHPEYQAALALHALNSNDPQIRELLVSLRAQIQADVDGLKAIGIRSSLTRDQLASLPLLKLYGIAADGRTKANMDQLRNITVRRMMALADKLAQCLRPNAAGRPHGLDGASAHMRQRAEASVRNRIIGRLLRTGGRFAHIRALVADAIPGAELPDAALMERYVRLARASDAFGMENRWAEGLVEPGPVRDGHIHLMDLFEQVHQGPSVARNYTNDFRNLSVCATADDALAHAHALLRDPSRFSPYRAEERHVRASVVVSADAFAELVERYRTHEAWDGLAPFISESDTLGEREPRERHLGAAATLRCVIGGRHVELRFLLPLERNALRSDRTRTARAATLLSEVLPSDDIELDSALIPDNADVVQWGGRRVERPPLTHMYADPAAASQVLALAGRHALLGPDECRHEQAEWKVDEQSFSVMVPARLRLSCPRCLRERVAVAPLHRDRVEGRRLVDDPEYLNAYRAQAAYFGERLPEHLTLSEAVMRDRHISLNPSDYASVDAPAAPRDGRRGQRLATLGARRR